MCMWEHVCIHIHTGTGAPEGRRRLVVVLNLSQRQCGLISMDPGSGSGPLQAQCVLLSAQRSIQPLCFHLTYKTQIIMCSKSQLTSRPGTPSPESTHLWFLLWKLISPVVTTLFQYICLSNRVLSPIVFSGQLPFPRSMEKLAISPRSPAHFWHEGSRWRPALVYSQGEGDLSIHLARSILRLWPSPPPHTHPASTVANRSRGGLEIKFTWSASKTCHVLLMQEDLASAFLKLTRFIGRHLRKQLTINLKTSSPCWCR